MIPQSMAKIRPFLGKGMPRGSHSQVFGAQILSIPIPTSWMGPVHSIIPVRVRDRSLEVRRNSQDFGELWMSYDDANVGSWSHWIPSQNLRESWNKFHDFWNSGGWQRSVVPLDPTFINLKLELNPGFFQPFPSPGFCIPAGFEDGEGRKELE